MRQETGMSTGFPPISGPDARVLILGSLPGQRSLEAGQYYAHPQNAFWRIMYELTGAEGSYDERCRTLVKSRIALWDVLKQSVRPGSMDVDIQLDVATANDFAGFFARHRAVELLCFNGQKAAQMFHKFVVLDEAIAPEQLEILPSTSPAYAAMAYADKLAKWGSVITEDQRRR